MSTSLIIKWDLSQLMSEQKESQDEQQLKLAVYLAVSKMVDRELPFVDGRVIASPSYVASLVELVYNQIINLGEDLELFANHADRSTIRPADLYMVCRKNDLLTLVLKEYEQKIDQD